MQVCGLWVQEQDLQILWPVIIHSFIADYRLVKAFEYVSPWAINPGSSGASAIKALSSLFQVGVSRGHPLVVSYQFFMFDK